MMVIWFGTSSDACTQWMDKMRLTQTEITEMEHLISDGFVSKRQHPSLDLFIANYTARAQYTGNWTPLLLRLRGMIIDENYNIIKAPFQKFFNLNEKLTIKDLPDSLPIITEKLDGFLTIMYPENGLPAMTTRGSFTSSMAIWATKWLRNTGLTLDDFKSDFTYLFETIEPALCREQHLVIDYHDRAECVLLAVRNTATGVEINHIDEAKRLNLPFAIDYMGSLEDAVSEMGTMGGSTEEGFVVLYSNGLRIKLKCESYHHLHKLLSGLTPKRILEALINDGDEGIESMITGIPDESYTRVKDTIQKIRDEQQRIIDEAQNVYDSVKDLPSRREQAEAISKSKYKSVAFAILNSGDYNLMALKQTRKVLKDIVGMNDQ